MLSILVAALGAEMRAETSFTTASILQRASATPACGLTRDVCTQMPWDDATMQFGAAEALIAGAAAYTWELDTSFLDLDDSRNTFTAANGLMIRSSLRVEWERNIIC